jgi:hypothetical protein
LDRTREAEGFLAHAHRRAELHHRLVVIAGMFRGEQCARERREYLCSTGGIAKRRRVARKAGKDTDNVAVHACCGCVEGNAGNRGRRVRSDARQLQPLGRRSRKFWTGGNDFGESMEIARSRIVAEAFPEFQYVCLVRVPLARGRALRNPVTPVASVRNTAKPFSPGFVAA